MEDPAHGSRPKCRPHVVLMASDEAIGVDRRMVLHLVEAMRYYADGLDSGAVNPSSASLQDRLACVSDLRRMTAWLEDIVLAYPQSHPDTAVVSIPEECKPPTGMTPLFYKRGDEPEEVAADRFERQERRYRPTVPEQVWAVVAATGERFPLDEDEPASLT